MRIFLASFVLSILTLTAAWGQLNVQCVNEDPVDNQLKARILVANQGENPIPLDQHEGNPRYVPPAVSAAM